MCVRAQQKAALDESEAENRELRGELETNYVPAAQAADEVDALKELLNEREAQLLALSRRLSEALEGNNENYPRAPGSGGRRESMSFLDRFNLNGKGSLLASGA